ncbi:uncharacterized protein EV420DRAFT_1540748 [Desarmillaria tabescens]|uniref:Uncharacterized protein n=1 Tax=Armillaria tabescens TaxID=1929756 RepID=A0AA39KCY0_ARMTA|nr:uncharacterized protein EV420DRAFT_1540748 [Desarmillaria tabescens]KAK0458830.1 hypothetical protein EV420DRAFT_1540748 [Desarmillaria tabescens]
MHDSLYERTPPQASSPSMMSTTSHRSRRTHRTQYTMPQPHPAPIPSPTPSNIAENLHMPSNESYNFDPNEPYIAVAGQESVIAAQSPPPPGGYRPHGGGWGDFVGGFRRVLGVGGGKRKADTAPMRVPSTRISMPRPLVVPVRDVERDARQQPYPQPQQQQYRMPTPPPPASAHGANDSVDGGTTAVDHEPTQPVHVRHNPPPSQLPSHMIGSPVLAEPQPGSDYAKMSDMVTPPPTEMSFSSYMSRVAQFFRDLNNLPWIAERITVDYVPGQPTQRLGRRMSGSTRPSQQVMSWYGGPHGSVNLLSDGSASVRYRQMPPQSPYAYGSPPPPIHLISQQPQMGMAYPGSGSVSQPPQAFMMHPQYPVGYIPYQPDTANIYAPQPQVASMQISGQYPYPVSHRPQQSV